MITEKLLFAALGGSIGDKRAAIIMQDYCLPIACSHRSYDEKGPVVEFGIHACWEAHCNVEEFFVHLGIEGIKAPRNLAKLPEGWRPEGLYVYEVSYEESEILPGGDYGNDDWSQLENGELRRPTLEELEPLTRGLAPWNGVVL